MKTIGHDDLLKILFYNPDTGCFWWIKDRNRGMQGKRAGGFAVKGYRRIEIDGKSYSEHHLAWFYVHSIWPTDQLDHINGCRDDNRIINLRECNNAQNAQNRRKSSGKLSQYLGVSKQNGKWIAQIRVAGKRKGLGVYPTEEAAAEAYRQAKKRLHFFQPIAPNEGRTA